MLIAEVEYKPQQKPIEHIKNPPSVWKLSHIRPTCVHFNCVYSFVSFLQFL